MNWHKRAAMAAAIVMSVSIGIFSAACGDDNNKTASGSSSASQGSVDDLTARVQRNEMLFALVSIDGIELHDIDDSINKDATIGATFAPDVRKFVRLMALTNWDASIKSEAQDVHDTAVTLLKAIEDGNVEAAKGPATETHESAHDFTAKAWNIIVKDLPVDAGGPQAHDEDEATPAAGATP